VPHALGLFVIVATAAALVAVLISRVGHGLGSLQAAATAFSLMVGTVACFAMLVDAVDVWVKGGAMTPHGRRMNRSLVSVALFAAVATAMLGGSLTLMVILGPALVIYLLIARSSLTPRRAAAGRAADGGTAAAGKASSPVAKQSVPASRQRRGGKKRR
jgi:hypothetical protein